MLKNTDLLYIRAGHARLKIKDLAMAYKKSSQRLHYTLERYQKDGFLHHPHALFDYSYFGLLLFRVYFKGAYVSDNDKHRIIETLSLNQSIVSVYELNGEYDLEIEFLVPNPSRFHRELRKVCEKIAKLNNYKILLNVVTNLYPRQYRDSTHLIERECIIGGDRKPITCNEREIAVMNILNEEPLARLSSVAKKAQLNVKTVSSILSSLEKNNILKGFRFVLNPKAVGYTRHRFFVKLHNLASHREDELMRFMVENKEIVEVNTTVGDWDVEVDIEVNDASKMRSLIHSLREQFKDLIESFAMIEIYDCYKKSSLPKSLFSKSDA